MSRYVKTASGGVYVHLRGKRGMTACGWPVKKNAKPGEKLFCTNCERTLK